MNRYDVILEWERRGGKGSSQGEDPGREGEVETRKPSVGGSWDRRGGTGRALSGRILLEEGR